MKQGGGELNELEISSWFFSDKKKRTVFYTKNVCREVLLYCNTQMTRWTNGEINNRKRTSTCELFLFKGAHLKNRTDIL